MTPKSAADRYSKTHTGEPLHWTDARKLAPVPEGLTPHAARDWRTEFARRLVELGVALKSRSGPSGTRRTPRAVRQVQADPAVFAAHDRLAARAGKSWNRWVLDHLPTVGSEE